jgi:hypothetical protein
LSTLTAKIQLTAMTARTNAMARKAETHYTEPPLNAAYQKMKIVVHSHLLFVRRTDVNSVRAKLGAAVNLHYVCSACQGTPTVSSSSQIACLCKKKFSVLNAKDGESEDGERDDIYKFLEESGNYYVSLLARGPSVESNSATYLKTCKAIIFNDSRIGNVTGQGVTSLVKRMDYSLVPKIMICSPL